MEWILLSSIVGLYIVLLMIGSRMVAFWRGVTKDSKVLFFGSGRVALPSLKYLHGIYPNLEVITQSSEGQRKVSNEV